MIKPIFTRFKLYHKKLKCYLYSTHNKRQAFAVRNYYRNKYKDLDYVLIGSI